MTSKGGLAGSSAVKRRSASAWRHRGTSTSPLRGYAQCERWRGCERVTGCERERAWRAGSSVVQRHRLPGLDHAADLPQAVDVVQRVAAHRDQVGGLAWRDRAELSLLAEQARG